MTVPQVAAALQISEKQVFRLIERAELPVTRIGRAVRVPESGVRRYIAENTFPCLTPSPAA